MNKDFDTFLSLPDQERRDVFDATAERLDTLATYIEKDFWVCRVLDGLYHGRPDTHPRLLFKGGTSLSKVFSAIHRFSEDIDVVVFRDDLGFTGDRDPTCEDHGRKARERLTNELKETASHYICMDLAACLSELFDPCKIIEDEEDASNSNYAPLNLLCFSNIGFFASDAWHLRTSCRGIFFLATGHDADGLDPDDLGQLSGQHRSSWLLDSSGLKSVRYLQAFQAVEGGCHRVYASL